MTAFTALDEHYGKPSMVIRECLRNLRSMNTVKSIYDIKANRQLLATINTNISTLKCYNFKLEEDDVENSTFLIEMEEKIPHSTYIKWEEEKIQLKNRAETISIDKFIDFYTSNVNIEENAQYLRKPNRAEDKGHPQKVQKALMLQSKFREANKRGGFGGRKFSKYDNKKGQTPFPPKGGAPIAIAKFCIFCETNTHPTAFCKVKKYTREYKQEKCMKKNACFMCFQLTEHKTATCPSTIKCFLSKTTSFQ